MSLDTVLFILAAILPIVMAALGGQLASVVLPANLDSQGLRV